MKTRYAVALFLSCLCASAHPMGNFSVSHYAGFTVGPRGVELEYVLDLAEIPTFELLRDWNLEAASPRLELERKARDQAAAWLANLDFTNGTARVKPALERVSIVIADGAGNLPILRITTHARLPVGSGTLRYEDRNYPDRAGWKEIVIRASQGVTLDKASQSEHDISKALTTYPADPTVAPPQDLRAEMGWTLVTPVKEDAPVIVTKAPTAKVRPQVIAAIPQPHTSQLAASPALMTKQAAPPGTVVRGDALSIFLRQREITPWMILVALATAFILGAAHALTPGHGKTIVAAYLVGSRGTLRHAAFLGAMVTLTHTIVVFLLGIATLVLFRYIVPEKVIQTLGVISGLSIIAIGAWVLQRRLRNRLHAHQHHHHHDHHHHDHHHPDHDHHHHHDHDHHHEHHHHGPGGHTHVPDEISWGGLMALGASGGLVPCESAVVLLLGAVALGRVGLGLLLLIAFSLGLALVLMSIGVLVVYGKSLLPKFGKPLSGRFLNVMPIASAAFVTLLGVIMTGVALGWIHPRWMLG